MKIKQLPKQVKKEELAKQIKQAQDALEANKVDVTKSQADNKRLEKVIADWELELHVE
jgi:septal ring factor EnvC (AmiA/AmiB activator)